MLEKGRILVLVVESDEHFYYSDEKSPSNLIQRELGEKGIYAETQQHPKAIIIGIIGASSKDNQNEIKKAVIKTAKDSIGNDKFKVIHHSNPFFKFKKCG